MPVSSISFKNKTYAALEEIRKHEERERSEIIEEALVSYIARKKRQYPFLFADAENGGGRPEGQNIA